MFNNRSLLQHHFCLSISQIRGRPAINFLREEESFDHLRVCAGQERFAQVVWPGSRTPCLLLSNNNNNNNNLLFSLSLLNYFSMDIEKWSLWLELFLYFSLIYNDEKNVYNSSILFFRHDSSSIKKLLEKYIEISSRGKTGVIWKIFSKNISGNKNPTTSLEKMMIRTKDEKESRIPPNNFNYYPSPSSSTSSTTPLFVATKKIKQNEPLPVPHYLSNPSTPRRIRGVEAR